LSRKYVFSLLAVVLVAVSACPIVAADKVDIQLTYPNGRSPKVFTAGWTFGAKATVDTGANSKKDLSQQVQWSGTGIFSPKVGAVSHPAFSQDGANTIQLSVNVGGKTYNKKFTVQTVDPDGYATVGDKAVCPADSHGCPGCPHIAVGIIKTGCAKVKVNGKPVALVGQTGTHAVCCGPNTYKLVEGDPDVLIDGKRVCRLGDKTQHCGGMGTIKDATFTVPNLFSGKFSGSASGKAQFAIKTANITGTFKGSHGSEGGGTTSVTLKGTYNPRSGAAEGTMSGTAGYVGLDNKPATARVAGKFTGRTKGNTFRGTWKGTATGITTMKVSGSFSAARSAK
jgi:uncharacterized Zn-binding protein involved in type VI secretion